MSGDPSRRTILCLSGFMGTGKSTVGALVAARRGARFTDLDAVIEETTGRTIAEIFAREGEPAFREIERREFEEVLADDGAPRVVALGGGALVSERSRALALGSAFVVVLEASVDEIMRRTAGDATRPLLALDRRGAIEQLLAARAAVYRDAHLLVNTDGRTAEEIAEHLAKCWSPPA